MNGRIKLALGAFLLAGCAPAELSLRKGFTVADVKQVAVINFTAPEAWREAGYGQIAADVFAKELAAMGFTTIDRSKTEKIISEQAFTGKELAETEAVREMGKALGADVVLLGAIQPPLREGRLVIPRPAPPDRRTRAKKPAPAVGIPDMSITAKMLNVESGVIYWVGRANSTAGASASNTIRSAVRLIVKRLKEALTVKS